jgi:sulfatase modifying factor 1
MPAVVSIWQHSGFRAGLALGLLGAAALLVSWVALEHRSPPERCPPGMSASGARCCGRGQSLVDGACRGEATDCSTAQLRNQRGHCVPRAGVVTLSGGELYIGAADWDGESGGERFPRTPVARFRLDASEVTRGRFGDRAAASAEPGLPVTNVSAVEADAFCRRQGGRLPTAAEWVWAAAGPSARRYPWGNTGLVCRRAAFGLAAGPCAEAGGPELAGSRPDGATPDGILDLAGNVAEWTRELDGTAAARGGSFRSTSAAELKSWAVSHGSEKALHIGFRCAYPP